MESIILGILLFVVCVVIVALIMNQICKGVQRSQDEREGLTGDEEYDARHPRYYKGEKRVENEEIF